MKIYFDKNILIVDAKEINYKIVYDPHCNSMLKLNIEAYDVLRKIMNIGSGNEFDFCDLENEIDYHDNILKFIDKLVKNSIFFYNNKDFENHSLFNKIDMQKGKLDLKIAYIHITQRCNLNCTYCYNKKNLNRWEELATEEWFSIIDKLKNCGIQTLIFTGGEPLLREDLLKIVRYANEKNFNIDILSNGSLFNDEKLEMLQYINNFIISLDSIDDDINELNRNNSKQYHILSNLKKIPDIYKSKVFIRSVITNENIEIIEKTKKFIEGELGLKHISTMFLPNNRLEIKLIPPIINSNGCEISSDNTSYFKNKIVNCGGCYKEIAINSNGDIYPCQNLIKDEFLLTNIKKDNWIDELKKSKITIEFMNMDVRNRGKCGKCNLRFICGGGCRATTYNVYNDLNAYPDFLCNHFKTNIINQLKSITFEKNKN